MTEASYDRPLLVAMTGATGAIYGVRLLETLYELGVEAHLIVSRWAEATIKTETERRPEDLRALAAVVYDEEDLAAPPYSSAFETAGMIVAPCSMRTLAAVANGLSDNLIQRAADVHLKERRKLVLLVRESPLSVIHLENMLRVAKAGAVVAPPVPAFYAKLRSLDDMVDHTVGRALDQLGVEHERIRRWGERRAVLRPVDDA
ncbi:MAG TPA: UbiX family flavin prenyltransferase [Gaiella sp.]|nr:UbiX family flavin prenyltransferase [Gaiella sp.]HWO81614.1 UbiX family flavin prenyltransferase [Gaiella sp.]